MRGIFYNNSEKRLRSGWRILVFLILFWCLAALTLAIKPLFGSMTKREYLENFSLMIIGILAISATLSVWISRKYLDKKSIVSMGLKPSKRAWTDLFFGFLLSAAMAGIFLFIAVKLNLVEINSINWEHRSFDLTTLSGYKSMMQTFAMATLVFLLLEHVLVGYWEELVFRGYLFQNMSSGMGRLPAILLSCVIYGVVHSMNPNATLLSSSIIILFGFLRIYGYLATGMLWLSMGMHIGWNFFQGPIFGFAASGHQTATWLELEILEPNWLSGGSFGPEGSLLIIPIVLLALMAMKVWSNRGRMTFSKQPLIS
ncbi:MAG: CPBP family intramembrane metalloprotease [Flavobacteriaceae bacterium]|nr:MAG: CPBP family intramembrane metalloprotease [Flavobacteriaceae bacterium]